MKTQLCNELGIDFPIIQAPIGGAAGPQLAAAVSNSGGLGTVVLTGRDGETARRMIHEIRTLTTKPFCTNFVMAYRGGYEEALEVSLEEGVPVISLFWGDPTPLVDPIHAAGAVLLLQAGSVEEARQAADAGVDIVVAQGWEAGGHVRGNIASLPLIPSVVDAVAPTPVVASGGIADGRGLAASLALGAAGAWIGTRFLGSVEANMPQVYRDHVLRGVAADTAYTTLFDGGWSDAPHRVLRNSTYNQWEQAGQPRPGQRPGEGETLATDSFGETVVRYESVTARDDHHGDIEAFPLFAGQSVGLVTKRQPAADIVRELVEEAERTLKRLARDL